MSHKLIVIVDADAIIAQTYPQDSNFEKAFKLSKYLINHKATLIYPVTAISEAATVLQTRLNSKESAYEVIRSMIDPQAMVMEVNQHTLASAFKHFSPKSSKKNTIFDCIIAAVAEENDADAIFSFDKFYKALGFRLASELN